MDHIDFGKYFLYDETSPSYLRWGVEQRSGQYGNIVNCNKLDIAGTIHHSGYWAVSLFAEEFRVHRVVLRLHGVKVDGYQVDHIDGDRKNNKYENLRIVEASLNSRNHTMRKDNTSGVVGVSFHARNNSWSATWHDLLTGKLRTKNFACKKYGEKQALKLACEYRSKIIEQLNEQGAGYTDRHGKGKERDT